MDKNRDLRRTAVSTVSGLPRRRQRVTTLRDSTDDDRQMVLKETVRLRDREQLQKKDRDRDLPKRRRVDNRSAVQQRSTDSSDEEYFEAETRIHQQNRTNQLSPASSSPSNSRRGIRTLRSSPVLRVAVDEVLGVPIPRRARSASAKKLHEYRNPCSGGLGEDSSHRKFPSSPATMSPIGSGGASSSSSGASMKKKMKYAEPRIRVLSGASNSKPSSVIQDDIEIEVAEALFDLMTQSHSQSQSSEKEEKVDRDSTNAADEELKRLKAERGKDENVAFKVQNEQLITVNAETILPDSMNKGGRIEKEKFTDDPAQELVSGDGFVDRGKVGSPKESESSSCVKVNACDIQDPTVTKADYPASVDEAKKKEVRIEIDLMALPSLPSSPEIDALPDFDPKVTTHDVQKKGEKIGEINGNQLLNLDLEKRRHDFSSVGDSTSQQPQGRKEPKIQSPTSLLSFPIGMGSWPGVLPHPGFMQSHRAVLPIDGNARSSMTMQPPKFKFTRPRTKRCTTHRYIADNIHHHQQLVTKSLSSGPTGAAGNLYGTKPLSLKSMLPTQRLVPGNPLLGDFPGGSGKDKSSDVASDFNATRSGRSVLQQASNQAPAHNFLHNRGFTFALGHHQTTMMAPANSSGPPQSASAISNVSLPSNSSRKLSANSSLPEASSTAASFIHPFFPSNEAAASYMAILQNAGCSIPIPTNIALPSFKGGSSTTVPFMNSSFYSQPLFNTAQNNKLSPQPERSGATVGVGSVPRSVKPSNNNNAQTYTFPQQGSKNRVELVPQPFPWSFGSNASTAPVLNFQKLPELSWSANTKFPTSEAKSQTDCAPLTMAPSKFDSSPQTLDFLPSSLSSVPIPSFYHHQHQMQLEGSSAVQTDYSSFLPKWDNFPRTTTTAPEGSSQSLVNIPQLKSSQGQNHITFGNNPAPIQEHHVVINSQQPVSSLIVGSSSNSSNLKNTSSGQRNASTVSVLASQESDSSPACRRVVPSILSTCASQLSEIKYG